MSKNATAAQRRRMGRIAELGCIIRTCQMPAIVHHCFTGAGGHRDHNLIIPLCPKHHAGHGAGVSLHDGRKAFYEEYGSERELLDMVNLMVD